MQVNDVCRCSGVSLIASIKACLVPFSSEVKLRKSISALITIHTVCLNAILDFLTFTSQLWLTCPQKTGPPIWTQRQLTSLSKGQCENTYTYRSGKLNSYSATQNSGQESIMRWITFLATPSNPYSYMHKILH